MKKALCTLVFLFPFLVFSQSFHIQNVEYNIKGSKFLPIGKTSVYALEQQVPVDKETVFESEELFIKYLNNYKIKLNNTRVFETIDVKYEIVFFNSTNECNEIILFVNLQDSFHLLALPHILSYNSNDGWKPKLKAKDSNFFGSLSTMSTDFYGIIPFDSENKNYEIGSELDFIIPFKMGVFDAEWKNDYVFSYDFSKPSPEWDLQTGLLIKYPFENCSLELEVNQYAFRNFDYEIFDDLTYFTEEAILSLPIKITTIKFLDDIFYKPFSSIYYNWDINKINILNEDLFSPKLTFGHQFYSSKINWNGNYRKGISTSLENSFSYYLNNSIFLPYLSLDSKLYTYFQLNESSWFNTIGLTFNFNIFRYFNLPSSNYEYTISIGSKLRGIRDDQTFAAGTSFFDKKALSTSSAIVLNFDIPIHIWTTDFNSKFMKIFNCEIQLSPFIDIGLCNNRVTGKNFSFKDGFYSSGFEVLVYPKKWSSFTIRGSLGFDIGRLLFKDSIDMSWRKNVSKYEISIGLGLFY